MDDVAQAILAVVLKEDGESPDPIDLTRSFERFAFAVDHQDIVPRHYTIKHFKDICRAGETPTLFHLEMVRSHLNCILQIMNGRVLVRTNIRKNDTRNSDWPDPTGYSVWRLWFGDGFSKEMHASQ